MAAILGGSGIIGAMLPVVPVAIVWSAFDGPSMSLGWASLLLITAAIADLVGIRPLSVQRQVPQQWGHGRPVQVVALRYGFRLGFAPATILTTWLWWAGSAVSVTHGVFVAALFAAIFVLTRTMTNVLAALGVSDGGSMSRRMALVTRRDVFSRRAAAALAIGVATGGLLL